MNIKVRYFSRSGNTKLLADAIAKGLNVEAISVDSTDSQITDNTDILFIGGALYAYGLDKKLKEYLSNIDGSKIRRSVVFSTSWLSKHSIDLIKNSLRSKGINVDEEYIYAKNKPSDEFLKKVESDVKKYL